jgi:hypothetical protein
LKTYRHRCKKLFNKCTCWSVTVAFSKSGSESN